MTSTRVYSKQEEWNIAKLEIFVVWDALIVEARSVRWKEGLKGCFQGIQ
jgi:hypothetical protein